MILQALYDLYNRLADDPANGLPKPGYSLQNITFRVVLKSDGTLIEIQDARKEEVEVGRNGKEKKTLRPISLLVPGQAKSSGSRLNPCFLWDNTGYLLGYKPDDPKPERNLAAFEAFKQKHLSLEAAINASEFSAVCRFLEHWSPLEAVKHKVLTEMKSGFGVFQISGTTNYVHQSNEIAKWWRQHVPDSKREVDGFCLVTGQPAKIARLHEPKIRGFDPSGSLLVSFNERAYESFGKNGKDAGQGRNSPVSEEAAFAYCNSLNYLLSSKGRHFRIGDSTTVFWTELPSAAEEIFPWMMDGNRETEDSEIKDRVKAALEKIGRGQLGTDDLGTATTRFFILGLSPNTSRLSVRFWHTGILGELTTNLQKHFAHLKLVRQWDETNSKNPEPLVPSVYSLLRQTARDANGISPLLGGAVMRSIILGTRYPDALVNGVLNRIRVVEKKSKGEGSVDNVNYLRASILKAWLIRNHHQPIKIMLDETNANPGYRLGRLFALLEKTQVDAQPGINATIRERFYSSASATPRAVFGRLLRTYQHHLAKLEKGPKTNREKQTQEILDTVSDFPAHLNLQNQAKFALGYYHQRKSFFVKRETEKAADQSDSEPQVRSSV